MNLRRTLLQLLATIAIPACVDPGHCPPSQSGTTELVEPVDGMLQALVDDCRAVGGFGPECEPLCLEVITRELGAPPSDDISECGLLDDTSVSTPLTATVDWTVGPRCIGGRRPADYASTNCAAPRADRIVGEYFAEQARLEAASVRAFLELADALAAHGAPRMLVQACRRAAGEEIVHAVLVGRIAVRHGVAPRFHHGTPMVMPTLEQLAHANAVEGCVRETWGAMVATWQGRVAIDPTVRAVMQQIAIEETKHATLSRAIHTWAMRRLDAGARARVAAARTEAFAELAATIATDVPAELVQLAGLPSRDVGIALMTALHGALA